MKVRGLPTLGVLLLLAGVCVWAFLTEGAEEPSAEVVRDAATDANPGEMHDAAESQAAGGPGAPRLVGAQPSAPARTGTSTSERTPASLPSRRAAGPEITGRVVDGSGGPLTGVVVRLRDAHGDRLVRHPGVQGHATTDSRGRYALVTPTPGPYSVSAEADGHGTGSTGPVDTRRAASIAAPDLVLRGEGWFAGVVVFPDGRPVVGVEVSGCIDLYRGGSWSRSIHPGLVSVHTRTDEEGRFRIAGLRPGPYAATLDETEALPGRIRAVSGDEDLRFVVRRRQLRVRICDAAGHLLEGALLDRFHPDRGSCSRRPVAGGVTSFYGEGGERFFLCAHDGEGISPMHEVSLPTDAWTQDVTLVPRRRGQGSGRIAVRVFDAQGGEVPHYRATVRMVETGTSVPWLDRVRPDDGGVLSDVPAGPWRVVVEPLATEPGEGHIFLFSSRTDVVVRPDVTTQADLVCRPGGRIRITSIWPEGMEVDSAASDVELEGPVDPPLEYLWPDPEEPEISPLLEPGTWVVVVSGEALKTQRIPVRVQAGRVADVEARLEAK